MREILLIVWVSLFTFYIINLKPKVIYVDREQCSSYEQVSIKEKTVSELVRFLVTTKNAAIRYEDKLYIVTAKEKE